MSLLGLFQYLQIDVGRRAVARSSIAISSIAFAAAVFIAATSSAEGATPLGIAYQGRLVNADGSPQVGTPDIEMSFFRDAVGGTALLTPRVFADVPLNDGVFALEINFTPADYHALFVDDAAVWIQLKELDRNLSLPRQRLSAAPFANKIPVDGTTLAFDNDGKLAVAQISSAQVSGLSAALAGKADSSALAGKADAAATTTALAAKADAAATTTALASKADAAATTTALAGKADAAHSHTLAGDVAGDIASNTVTKLQGVPVDSTAPSTVGQVLKWDGSQWAPGPDDGGVAGAISNGSNLGGGNNLFKAVNGSALEFRTVTGSGNISATTDGDNIQITTTAGLTSSAQAGLVAAPYGTGAGNTGELRFQELAAGGGNFVAFKAPDALAADTTYTLPTAAPASNGQILSGSTAGALSWTTLPTALPPSGAAGGDLAGSYPNPTIAAAAVTSTALAGGAVTTAKIASGAVTGAELAADSITTSKLVDGAVTSAKIAADTITAADIAADAVSASELIDSAVTTNKLAADAVTTAKIADGTIADVDLSASAAITRGKLAAGTANHVIINDASGVLGSEPQLGKSRGGTGISSTATFPSSGVIVTEAATETLTNKTLTSPILNTPDLNGGTADGLTSLSVRDTSAAFDVTLSATSTTTLTAGRSLTVDVDNANRILALKKNLTVNTGDITFTGQAGGSSVTLPSAGTLATLAGVETLTNKTLSSPTLTAPTINGGSMTVSLGAVGTPSYAFSGDANTGVWSVGADTLNISTAGSERLRIDANGMVGIGTTSPGQKLTVAGTIESSSGGFKFPDGSTQTTASVSSGAIGMGAYLGVVHAVGAGTGYGVTSASQDFSIPSNAAFAKMGNVCNGTPSLLAQTSWSFKDGSGTVIVSGQGCYEGANTISTVREVLFPVPVGAATLTLTASTPHTGDGFNAAQIAMSYFGGTVPTALATQWANNGTSISYSAGNVGIGTTTPNAPLQVVLPASVTSGSHEIADFSDTTNGVRIGWRADGTSVTSAYLRAINNKPLTLATTGTINSGGAMTILDGGNVGIGTTSPSERLDLGGGNVKMGFESVAANCMNASYCIASCSAGKTAIGGGCVGTDYSLGFGGSTKACSYGTFGNTSDNCWLCVSAGQVVLSQITAMVNCANIK